MSVHGRISVLAAWCETDSHLVVPDRCSLAAQRVCDILAGSGWRPSQPLSEDLRSRIKAAAQLSDRRNGSGLNLGTPLTNAEVSQRSVDILLREYYNMMQAQQRAAQHKSDASGGTALSRVFLLFCPVLPCCLDLQHLLAAAVKLTQVASRLVVLLSCFIIPLWLTAIRELIHYQQHQQAITVALAGLTCFMLADVINRHTEKTRRAAARQVVTAATARQSCTSAGGISTELLALTQASRTATTSNSSKQTLAQQQLQQWQIQQQEAGAGASGAMSTGRGAGSPPAGVHRSVPSYLELLPALAALQSALGVPGTAGSVNSREKLAEELGRVCTIMGITITPDMTASPTAMAATIAHLNSSIGI